MTESSSDPGRPADANLAALLDTWFAPDSRARWFDATPDFDAMLRRRFLGLYEQAARGDLAAWRADGPGCLGLVLLLDQIPRNVFRDSRHAFATDDRALAVTQHALDHGLDRQLDEPARLFLYLPLEHAEDLALQDRAVALIAELTSEPMWADYARKHREVIARFGRFPHRNALLGRASTAEEQEFLEQGIGW
jgi:uncharacterized protein (DUF924 family)